MKLNQKEADVDHQNKVGEAAESYVMVQYGNLWHINFSAGTDQTFKYLCKLNLLRFPF